MNKRWKTIVLGQLTISMFALTATAQEIPAPPWLMSGTYGIEVGYALDEATVRRLLPKGIEPVKEMTGGFELYISPEGYGITPYSAFNVFVDVEGLDMPDGRKGRWMLMGFYGPSEQVASALREHYAWPVRAGSARVQKNGQVWTWTGSANGKDLIEARIKRKAGKCETHRALDFWSGQSASGAVLINPIPNTLCIRDVELSGVEMRVPAGDPLAALQPGKKPIAYAVEWENGAWSFTTAVQKP
jgi:acetoacetate decarboxylase